MKDHNQDDDIEDIEDLYMNEWLEYGIAVLITLVSLAAFCFWLGYLL
jgi:hypothetical protein